MSPLGKLATRLKKALPAARIDVSEPAAKGSVGFLDVSYRGNVLAVQWEKEHFGVSSPEGHGYGERPDELFANVEEAASRMVALLKSGGKTQPPLPVTLHELRAERKLPQTELAATLCISQPAVSRLFDRGVSRMMVSTLQAVVEAMGGQLTLSARFSDGRVRQIQLDDPPSTESGAKTTANGSRRRRGRPDRGSDASPNRTVR